MVAIDPDFLNFLNMTGGAPFQPEFIPAPALVIGLPGLQGLFPSCWIHESQHQDLAGLPILGDGRQKAAAFFKIRFLFFQNFLFS